MIDGVLSMGRRVGLTQQAVVAAAARIADEDGLEAVSMAAVAERLGVRSPSLYAHVDGLAGLHRRLTILAATALADELRASRHRRHGAVALQALANAYRAFASNHPGWYAAAQQAVPPGKDDALYRTLAESVLPVMETLAEMGVPPADLLHQTRAVRSALHGFVTLERGNSFGMSVDFDESFQRLVELVTRGVVGPPATSLRTAPGSTAASRP
ncbi:MAG: TetR-like C-terminal domain-containing protein [Gemmatimonadales bacterium]